MNQIWKPKSKLPTKRLSISNHQTPYKDKISTHLTVHLDNQNLPKTSKLVNRLFNIDTDKDALRLSGLLGS